MRLCLGIIVGVQLLILMPANAAPWVQFTDPSGRFSVLFPTPPQTKGAGPLKAYFAEEGANKAMFMIVDKDLMDPNLDAEKTLDDQTSYFLKLMTSGNSKAITVDGVNVRYVTCIQQGSIHVTNQFFVLGSHLYQVVAEVFGSAGQAPSVQGTEDAKTFSASLHFVH